MTWQETLNEQSSRGAYYRQVVTFLTSRRRKAASRDAISFQLGMPYDWTAHLLKEMRLAGLVFYSSGWGWRLRKGVCWPVHLLNPVEEAIP